MQNENRVTLADTPHDEFQAGRRRALKTGAFLVPTILTLHAAPAWATTDYTTTAYRYGTNAGLCRNPNYQENANPDSEAGQEFIECPEGPGRRRNRHTSGDETTGSSGTSDFQRE